MAKNRRLKIHYDSGHVKQEMAAGGLSRGMAAESL